jgi:hypothetical protein
MLEMVVVKGKVCAAEGAGKDTEAGAEAGAVNGAFTIEAVGAPSIFFPPSATPPPICATGAIPTSTLFLRSATTTPPFFNVSHRNCLDSFARWLYSPTLRNESSAVRTSGVVCGEISGREEFADMTVGVKAALNILFLNDRKDRD